MKQLTITLAICCLCNSLQATAEQPTLREAIALSIDQQLLVQNLANTYLILCHDPKAVVQYDIRAKSVSRFEEQLYQLGLLVPTPRIRKAIQQVRLEWQAYQKTVDWSIHKNTVIKIIEQATQLQETCQQLFAAYREYEYSFKRSSDLVTVNQYISQTHQLKCILAQLTTYYLAHQLAHEEQEYKYRLIELRRIFMRSLVILQRAETGAAMVGQQLLDIGHIWKGMEQVIIAEDRGLVSREEWLSYMGTMLQGLDQIIGTYEQLSAHISRNHAVATSIQQTICIQQIASVYLIHMSDGHQSDHYEDLLQHIQSFEDGLEALRATVGSDETVQRTVRTAKVLWNNYKDLALRVGERDEIRAIKLIEQCHVLTAACDQVQRAVEESRQKKAPLLTYSTTQEQIQRLHQLQICLERWQVYRQLVAMNIDRSFSEKRRQSCEQRFVELMHLVELHQAEDETLQKHWGKLLEQFERYRHEGATNKKAIADVLRRLTHWYDHRIHSSYAQQLR